MKPRLNASRLSALVRAAVVACLAAFPAAAGPFSPVKFVNGLAITQYELDQRILFMELLRQPGDIEAEAMAALIDDRIKQSLARQFDFELEPDVVKAGMEEFASQANLTADEFIKALGEVGVDQQTFRDFVESGLIWRETVRAKFAGRIQISEADIDRALIGKQPLVAIQVRLAEIVLPAVGAARGPALAKAHRLQLELRAGAEFSELARKNSSAPTAGNGGVMEWKLLSQLEPDAAVAVRSLKVGQASEPVVLDDSIVLYQMLEFKQEALPPATAKVVDYAELLVPDSASEIAKVKNSIDDCDGLYAIAKKMPPGSLQRQTVPIGQLPRDVAGVLMTLDAGESSVALTRGGMRVFLMLCRRGEPDSEQPTRDEVRLQLTNQRLGVMAEVLIEQLRSAAVIADP